MRLGKFILHILFIVFPPVLFTCRWGHDLRHFPSNSCDEALVKRHSLHGEALKRYILKEVDFQITPRLLRLPEEKRLGRLANYCNIHVFYGAYFGQARDALLADVKDHESPWEWMGTD